MAADNKEVVAARAAAETRPARRNFPHAAIDRKTYTSLFKLKFKLRYENKQTNLDNGGGARLRCLLRADCG
ncbi:hypothetical protein SAMN05216327_105197 [Dyadobacter sp. SG02]|nr:hypothetical protein SAMN05216327_105197 [Dyadobacter sp. SG02]